MKTIIASIAALLFFTASYSQTVDLSKSTIYWKGEKLTGFHEGNIKLASAKLTEQNGALLSAEFVVDMGSITCTDIADSKTNQSFVGHLKSDDFFGTDKHKTSKMVLISASPFAAGKAKVKADLTIKGVTHPIEFELVKSDEGYKASLTVDRTLYGIRYGSGSFFADLGDKMIYDNFILEVSLVAAKK
jgi:polyisoprenoid-binding protein YceI